MRWRIVLPGMAAVVLAGCAGSQGPGVPGADGGTPAAGRTSALTGTVLGRFEMEGGPLQPGGGQPPVRPLSGTVSFTGPGHEVDVTVGTSGIFSVTLPGGSYTVRGRATAITQQGPGGSALSQPCSPSLSITVRAGHTEPVTVSCIVP
jgi:hypothetical protein